MQSLERTDKGGAPTPAGDEADKSDTQPGLIARDAARSVDNTISSDGPLDVEDDQTAAALIKPVRKRDKAHRDFVCSQPCLSAAGVPPMRITSSLGSRARLAAKVSDEFTVPLSRVHHRELHRGNDEKKWWGTANIDAIEMAQRLWRETHD